MEFISENKRKHMFGVAEFMAERAEEFGYQPEEMYVLGLLHDIGYIHGYNEHAYYGANLLYGLGFKRTSTIAGHELSPEKYCRVHLVEEPPKDLILLWMADMSVNHVGERVGYDARLEEIQERYGEDSKQYRTSEKIVEYLKKREAKK